MKRILMITVLLLLSLTCLACGQESDNSKTADVSAKKIDTASTNTADKSSSNSTMVIYFSQTGSTAEIGDNIADILKADKYVIKAKIPYTKDDINYHNDGCRANLEQRDNSARPEISGDLPNLSQYDTIYIGYPIWWGQAPKIMYTFVEKCDLSDKKVIPFCVSAQSDIGDSAKVLAEVSKGKAKWNEGRRFPAGTSKEDIKNWVNEQ